MELAKWVACLLHVLCGAAGTRRGDTAKAETAMEFVKKEIEGERALMETQRRRAAERQARRQAHMHDQDVWHTQIKKYVCQQACSVQDLLEDTSSAF